MDRWEGIAHDIARDRSSGAEALAARARDAFAAWLADNRYSDRTSFYSDLVQVGRRVVESQPSMAPIFNLGNRLLLSVRAAMDADADLVALRAVVDDELRGWEKNARTAKEKLSKAGARLIEQGSTILVHSASSTVENVLLDACKRGIKFRAIVTESRPTNEGERMATVLGKAEVQVKYIVDAAIGVLVPTATMVMVGADWIDGRSVVNKVGTRPITAVARVEKVPAYVVTYATKFAPLVFSPEIYDNRDPREILPRPPKNVSPHNRYYDITPLEWFAGLVTDRGILSPQDVALVLANARIAADLIVEKRK